MEPDASTAATGNAPSPSGLRPLLHKDQPHVRAQHSSLARAPSDRGRGCLPPVSHHRYLRGRGPLGARAPCQGAGLVRPADDGRRSLATCGADVAMARRPTARTRGLPRASGADARSDRLAARQLRPAAAEQLRRHVVRSARGMIAVVERIDDSGALQLKTMQELRDYCYMVAGIVGEMLTELFLFRARRCKTVAVELRARAVEFGEALQLVNILKDSQADGAEERSYLPGRAGLAEVFSLARSDLRRADRVHRASAHARRRSRAGGVQRAQSPPRDRDPAPAARARARGQADAPAGRRHGGRGDEGGHQRRCPVPGAALDASTSGKSWPNGRARASRFTRSTSTGRWSACSRPSDSIAITRAPRDRTSSTRPARATWICSPGSACSPSVAITRRSRRR